MQGQGHIAVPVVQGGRPEPFLEQPAMFQADPAAMRSAMEQAEAQIAYHNLVLSEERKRIKAAVEAQMMEENALRQRLVYSSSPLAHSNIQAM